MRGEGRGKGREGDVRGAGREGREERVRDMLSSYTSLRNVEVFA